MPLRTTVRVSVQCSVSYDDLLLTPLSDIAPAGKVVSLDSWGKSHIAPGQYYMMISKTSLVWVGFEIEMKFGFALCKYKLLLFYGSVIYVALGMKTGHKN